MINSWPIIVIEDDPDDLEILTESILECGIRNKLISFDSGSDAIAFLKTTDEQPLFILCDVNLPKQNGIELKQEIDSNPDLKIKNIPFIFYSTLVSQYGINQAYDSVTVQGYFQKNDTFEEFTNVIRAIYNYWSLCKHPKNYDFKKL